MQDNSVHESKVRDGDRLTLKRHIYTQSQIEAEYRKGTPSRPSLTDKIKSKCRCSKQNVWTVITTYLPIVKFVVKYDVKGFFLGDLLAGFSVSLMHLPQAMGLGILAGLSPAYGLYTAFFPALFYLLLGTSPHISFGTNAVLALLTQNVVDREVSIYKDNLRSSLNATAGTTLTLFIPENNSTTWYPDLNSTANHVTWYPDANSTTDNSARYQGANGTADNSTRYSDNDRTTLNATWYQDANTTYGNVTWYPDPHTTDGNVTWHPNTNTTGRNMTWNRDANTTYGNVTWYPDANATAGNVIWSRDANTTAGNVTWYPDSNTTAGNATWSQYANTTAGNETWSRDAKTTSENVARYEDANTIAGNVTWSQDANATAGNVARYGNANTTVENTTWSTSNATSVDNMGNYTMNEPGDYTSLDNMTDYRDNLTSNTNDYDDNLTGITTEFYNDITDMITETLSAMAPLPDTEEELLKVKVGVAMTSSLVIGTILGGMGLLRLGFLANYLSVSCIGGFTTGASIHIISSQIPKILGIEVGIHSGVGRLVKMYIDLFSNISDIKPPEVVIGVVCIILLLAVKIFNDLLKKKIIFPIPVDLILMIIGAIASHFGKFEEKFDVVVIGDVPSGIPVPKVPALDNTYRIAIDCVVMAIMSFAMSVSLAKTTATINEIKIDHNQELLAYGISNMGSSFFSCFPQATSPPRTVMLHTTGSKTTLNAIPSVILLVVVIFWIGHLFESLPVSVLAAIIIVSMKDLLIQFRDLYRYWKVSVYDCLVWLIAWAITVFVDLDYGIVCGIGVSIFFVVVQHQIGKGRLLGQSETEDVIIDVKYRSRLLEYPGIKIFQFDSPLYFVNAERFQSELNRLVVNPFKIKKAQRLYGPVIQIDVQSPYGKSTEVNGKLKVGKEDSVRTFTQRRNYLKKLSNEVPHHIIIDCHMITHTDMAGVAMLQTIIKEYKDIEVTVFLANCPERTLSVLEAAGFFNTFPKEHVFFDVVDAIEVAAHSDTCDVAPEPQSGGKEKPHYSGHSENKYEEIRHVVYDNLQNSTYDDEITKL